jgi:hypothetical protein
MLSGKLKRRRKVLKGEVGGLTFSARSCSTMVAALAQREGVELAAETIAKHSSEDGAVRAVLAVSKRYEKRSTFPYWYAYHPDWDDFLSEASQSAWLLLGCMDRPEAYAVPRSVLIDHLDGLNTTVRKDTGKLHWHIHLVERDGEIAMLLPKRDGDLTMAPHRLGAGPSDPVAALEAAE